MQKLHTINTTEAFNAYKNVKENKLLMRGQKVLHRDFRSGNMEKFLIEDVGAYIEASKREEQKMDSNSSPMLKRQETVQMFEMQRDIEVQEENKFNIESQLSLLRKNFRIKYL